MAKAYHMIGWTIWAPAKKSTGFGKGSLRTLGKSWWKRNKPITVYQTESICNRYVTGDEKAVPVYIRIDGNDPKGLNDSTEK